MTFEIKITYEFDGVKPRNFLKKRLNCPYFKIPKHIKNKRITLNGKKIKEDDVLRDGDIIKVWLDELKMSQEKIEEKEKNKDPIEEIDLKIPIIYENDDILVLNKTAGVSVQGGMQKENRLINHLEYLTNKDTSQNSKFSEGLDQEISNKFLSYDEQDSSKIVSKKNSLKSDFRYFHVHRLDKQTSGILIIAKNHMTLREFNQNFRERVMKKVYVCLVYGKPPKSEDKIELFLERTPQEVREKVIVVDSKTEISKNSISFYKVLKTVKFQNETFSLVEVEIKTGITHQIRVHMKYLGCPIVGDYMYGNSNINDFAKKHLNLSRQFLHSKYMEFTFKEKDFKIKAPLLDDLKECLDKLCIKENL